MSLDRCFAVYSSLARSNLSSQPQTKQECRKAKKILEQYQRLAEKHGVRLSPRRLEELNELREAKTITINALPSTLRREFPLGTFNSMTLAEIEELCGM
ncbi:hypothetical protein [Allocoleopsis sp.]|uniref:hypothetical protein n=1 Tax=Allocoleopsis sp. TaxID=3088169 RepID=UPI002FCFC251